MAKKNGYTICGDHSIVYIIRRSGEIYEFLVDSEDLVLLGDRSWSLSLHPSGRARVEARVGGRLIYVHRHILGVREPSLYVDHINGNSLDNRKSNLRLCSNAENLRNRGKTRANTSGFKGVTAQGGRWKAQIKVNYTHVSLGSYSTKEEAHAAYCGAAAKFHGRFSNEG